MNTWTKINNEFIVLDNKSGNPTNLKHSIIPKEKLTFKYWDYLAWAVATLDNPYILSIGHGAGTFLKILEKWGIECTGVGIEIDKGYMDFNTEKDKFIIRYCNFKDFVKESTDKFDLIIVDVYDEKGYVSEAYDEQFFSLYLKLLRPNGRIVFHCVEFSGTLLATETEIKKVPSIFITMIMLIKSMTLKDIFVIPMWSSYLLWVGNLGEKIDSCYNEVRWLDLFFKNRIIPIIREVHNIPQIERPWTYTKIQDYEKSIIDNLFLEDPDVYYRLTEIIEIMGPLLNNKDKSLDYSTAEYSLKTLENKEHSIEHELSFIYALNKNWEKAMEHVSKYKLKNIFNY